MAASAIVFAAQPAEARHQRHAHRRYAYVVTHVHRHLAHHGGHRSAVIPVSPQFSAVVMDANSGRTLYGVDEDGVRHPASITKVMTLYLLFERLDNGTMTLETRIPVSEHAADQEPSKLGIRPGETIRVEDAIKAVVTRSANDIAVAIAEAVGHDESSFAEMMTRKARQLGMSNTVYVNATGLPDDRQLTSARDISILGRAIEDRFPRYFKYFSLRQFEYAGRTIGSHDHLLGRVDGVDGIKTGYTRGSGFNLLTSVHRDGRSLIAVVMGGRTAASRDRIMENLISDHIAQASTVRTATMVADASEAKIQTESRTRPRSAPPRPAMVVAKVPEYVGPSIAEGDDSDDSDGSPKALRVAAVDWRKAPTPVPTPPRDIDRVRVASISDDPPRPADPPSPAQLGWVKGPDAAVGASPPSLRRSAGKERTAAAPAQGREDPQGGKDWIIQIGATDDIAKANALLDKARRRSRSILAEATPVTEKVRRGEDTLYRARFAGLDSQTAETACRSLKRDGFSCFAARD